MEYTTTLMREVAKQIGQEMAEQWKRGEVADVAEMEGSVEERLKQLGKVCVEEMLAELAEGYPAEQSACACGEQADYRYRRQGTVVTQFGQVKYRRAYYVCEACKQGHYPLDRLLGIAPGEVSPALGSKVAMLGVQTGFDEARRLADALLRVQVSSTTVHKETLRFGMLQEAREEEWKEESQDADHLLARTRQSAQRPQRLYGSLDEVKAPLNEEWRALKVGCWYEVEAAPVSRTLPPPSASGAVPEEDEKEPQLRAVDISYFCDFADPEVFGDLVWASGCQRDADLAQEIVFVADGAKWIWKLVDHHFPDAVQIVDWYHAVSYLSPIAQAAFPEPKMAQAWHDRVETLLWEGKVSKVIAECQRLGEKFPSAADPVKSAITYFSNNRKRLDYAHFRKQGYLIGSGVVESACKQICTHRLKRSGARWSEDGARKTAKARAAWLNNQWHDLSRRRAQLNRAA